MKKSGDFVLQSNGMSTMAASFTSTQNGLERWKLSRELQQIECEEYFTRINKGREIHKLKDLVMEYVATGCVFRQHRFEKYDPFRKGDRVYNGEIKRPFYKTKRGSVSQSSMTTNDQLISPKLERSKTAIEELSRDVRELPLMHQSLPNITKPMERPLTIQDDSTGSDDQDVSYQIRSKSVADCDSENAEFQRTTACFLPTIKRVALWEQTNNDHKEEEKNERIRHRKHQPILKAEFQKMFPGNCKTTYSMRRFIDKETKHVLRDIDTIPRKRNSREHAQLMKQSQMPDFIDRHKTTSAILRDFRSIRRHLHVTEDKIDKQPMTEAGYNHVLRFLELADSFES
ncbi:uncharacterized protein LOC130048516 [Ostrea edulis]|uniref:uncharacterized protein LOC130048516 n=1 Tax=Ostrea edulis TaxID=37623 RepID=UPI0024AF513A|nr:uncharacterized protein LOC130048516 [Ostrea edulis]